MKRSSTSLVSYSDSSSEDDARSNSPTSPEKLPTAAQKKRKLPPLATHLTVAAPIDDPAQHQGRVRTTPHVDGQWAAHVYVPVSAGRSLVRTAFARALESVPNLQALGGGELHISLTRPVYLRAHQREEIKRAVRAVARAHAP